MTITAETILINTGSEPIVLDIPACGPASTP